MSDKFLLLNQNENRIEKKYFCDSLIDFYKIGHLKKQYYYTYLLGYCYDYGISVEEDSNLARYYYNIAAENKVSEAMRALGLMYIALNDSLNGIYWLVKAYENNDKLSGYKLGQIYYDGKFVNKDFNKAYNYFINTTEIKASLFMLGECYYYGNGTQIDYLKALDYYIKSDYIKAYYMIGLIYHKHIGDFAKAIIYYHKAINYDDERALLNLGIIYFEKNDYEESLRLLMPLASKGNAKAIEYINQLNNNFKYNYS